MCCLGMVLIYHAVCLATGSYLLPHRERSSASSLKFQYLLFSLMPSSICIHLLLRLPVPSIFPSITCLRSQFIHNMWPIQLPYLLTAVCRVLQRLCFFMYVTIITQTNNNRWEHNFITMYPTRWRHVLALMCASHPVIYISIIYRRTEF